MPPQVTGHDLSITGQRCGCDRSGHCGGLRLRYADTREATGKTVNELPRAGTDHDEAMRRKIRLAVTTRNRASAANNTKWDELIDYFRERDGWSPSYHFKYVTGYISGWDVEWFCRLPFPFVGVEWFDIGLWQMAPSQGLPLPPPRPSTTPRTSRRSSPGSASSSRWGPRCCESGATCPSPMRISHRPDGRVRSALAADSSPERR